MARNEAAIELQNLLDAQQDMATTADAATILENTRQSMGQDVRTSDGEQAEFSTPEALVTAIGSGLILGPVGGLLLGVAQGFLGKRAKQNELDAWAANSEIANDTREIYNAQLDSLEQSANTPEDIDQLNALRTEMNAAFKFMTAADPRMQQNGAQMLSAFSQGVNDYSARQETQRIAREAATEKARLDMDNTQFSRHSSLLDDYDAQSSSYEKVQLAINNTKEQIARGNPVDINAALIGVNKALDPESVVRPEEAQAFGNFGTLWERGKTLVMQGLETGQAMSPKQREQLMTLVDGLERQNTAMQMSRDARFTERANDAGLPEKYINDFRRVTDVPAFKPGAFENVQEPLTGTGEALKEAVEPFSDQAIIDYLTPGANSPITSDGVNAYQEANRKLAEKMREQRASGARPTN